MSDAKYINRDQICTVRTFSKTQCHWYFYQKEIKGFWHKQKEGFYCMWDHNLYTAAEVIKCKHDGIPVFIEDNLVYYKPHLEIRMSNQSMHRKIFETVEDMMKYVDDEKFTQGNWIYENMM